MNTSSGFTIIELMALIILVGVISIVGYDRYGAVQSIHRDQTRKVAINTIHHTLDEIVKPKLGGYPRILEASKLTGLDKAFLSDPHGKRIGSSRSDYRYEPTGCGGDDICASYTLSANLENEADYVKTPDAN